MTKGNTRRQGGVATRTGRRRRILALALLLSVVSAGAILGLWPWWTRVDPDGRRLGWTVMRGISQRARRAPGTLQAFVAGLATREEPPPSAEGVGEAGSPTAGLLPPVSLIDEAESSANESTFG